LFLKPALALISILDGRDSVLEDDLLHRMIEALLGGPGRRLEYGPPAILI